MSEYQRWTNSVVDFTAFPTDPIDDERHDVLVCLFFEEQDLPETPSITGSGASMTFAISAETVPLAEWREICLRRLETVGAQGTVRAYEEMVLGTF